MLKIWDCWIKLDQDLSYWKIQRTSELKNIVVHSWRCSSTSSPFFCYRVFLGLEITMNGTKSQPVYTTSSVDDGGSNTTGRSPSETQRAAPASANLPLSRWHSENYDLLCILMWDLPLYYKCNVVFVFQGNYWSSNVNEVQGFVMDQEGKVIHRLFGKWHEGLYCGVPPSAKCVWRPGRHCFFASLVLWVLGVKYRNGRKVNDELIFRFEVFGLCSVFLCQAPCPQTMSCIMASPGLPLNWTSSAPS